MKRHQAKQIGNSNAKAITDLKTARDKVSDAAQNLFESGELTIETVKQLSDVIADEQGYQKEQVVVCDIAELDQHLSQISLDLLKQPTYVIYRNEKTFVIFCVLKLDDKIVCLYKDFCDTTVSGTLKNILEQRTRTNVEYKVHAVTNNNEDTAILALKMLETIMIQLKTDTWMDFIHNFTNSKKTFFEWLKIGVGNLKNELFLKVKHAYSEAFTSAIDQLSADEEFKKAIKVFTDSIPSIEEMEDVNNYQVLLKKFADIEISKINIDDKEVLELRNKLKRARQAILKKAEEAMNTKTYRNEKDETELDIVKNFPEQMKKFTNIFQLLAKSKVDDNSDKVLKEVSEKLGLDYKKIKSYFKTTVETKPEEIGADSVSGINCVINNLPAMEIKDDSVSHTTKSFTRLLDETAVENPNVAIDVLKKNHGTVKSFRRSWCKKEASQIYQWAVGKKGSLKEFEMYEALAVMDRANELATGGHTLRDTQILSIIAFLRQKNKGLLSQIQTGEGKTNIVAILSAIFALQGKQVDVITSNPVLASEVVKDKRNFYGLLNLTASTNNSDDSYESGARKCYEADVVYGSINNFQFDFLKDSFLGLNTRGGRPFDKIILDEVDSMIIDNASHIAKLSNPLPGMESLRYVYINIWLALHKAEKSIVEHLQKQLRLKALEVSGKPNAQMLYEQYLNQEKHSISDRIKEYIRSSNPTKIDLIPSHLKEYADKSLEKWMKSAIDAKYYYEEEVQYVIGYNDGERVVQPVDYSNTGITMKNMMWQYGLHQFLQLKHNLHLTSESLTSCFISNLGYINKYGGNIFGVTGTLGSAAERELLSSLYNVEYLKIPTFREKKFTEIHGEVVDPEELCKKVTSDAISIIDDRRSALIICETIKQAKAIRDALKRERDNITIRTFFNEDHAHVTEEQVDIAEVIIATNIAGRGTDLKTSPELDNNGGLHVIVAFLPCNKRVEDQAFGRTARQGNSGTAKLIMKKDEVSILGDDFEEIKQKRDLKERERIRHIKEVRVRDIIFQDKLFELFSDLYTNLKNRYLDTVGYKYVLDDLKEYWAFWLEQNDFNGRTLMEKSPEKEFKMFESKARGIIEGKILFNQFYAIQQAERYILLDRVENAESALNRAIASSKNPEILYGAYMKLFDIAVHQGGVFVDKCRKAIGDIVPLPMPEPDRNYKQKAKKYLELAESAIKKELDYIEHILKDDELPNIINNESANVIINDSYWFSDDDMHIIGETVLKPFVENIETQFLSRLTDDQIDTFCKDFQLNHNLPVFICYDIGGQHWIGICILKTADGVSLFYKDPKGDFANNLRLANTEFGKRLKNLSVIAHSGSEQKDGCSCAPITLDNLRIMAKSIKDVGLEKFVENFTTLKFSEQKDVARLRNEFARPREDNIKENLLIKHIVSRQVALNLYMNHSASLKTQIDERTGGISIACRIPDYFSTSERQNTIEESGLSKLTATVRSVANNPILKNVIGIAANSRIPDHFSKFEPQNDEESKIKNVVGNCELSELAATGANITYALRQVHDVCPGIVNGARIQISGGIALFATGCCFPPAQIVTSSLSGTMITEGICDIVFELINMNSDGQFNKQAYVKSKVISYGISLLTMGINALLQCPKILNAAKKACRWISTTLRRCPYLKGVCEYLATKIDQLHTWFDRMEVLTKFSKMSDAEKLKYYKELKKSKNLTELTYLGKNLQEIRILEETGIRINELTRFEKCLSSLQQVSSSIARNVTQRTAEHVIMNKVITPMLSSSMAGLKPKIKEQVAKSVRKNIDREKIRRATLDDVQNIIKKINDSINFDTIKDIFKDTILGITKYCSDYRIQLASLAIDQYRCWEELYNYVENLCKSININLGQSEFENHNTDELINELIEQISEVVYGKLLNAITKTCRDIHSVGKSAYQNYKKNEEEKAKCLKINEAFRKGGPASQEHVRALSDVIKRPIHICERNGNKVILGEQYSGDPIILDYFPPDNNNETGHYVPQGKSENWSSNDNNDCLLHAVGSIIGENSSKLRELIIKRIEEDPTRYIDSNARNFVEEDIFLEGGQRKGKRKSNPIGTDHYPSYLNRIKVIPREKCERIFGQIADKLDDYKKREERFSQKGQAEKLRQTRINENAPQFCSTEDKEEMMMGILIANFTNGDRCKLMTVSGSDQFSTTATVSHDENLRTTKSTKPASFRIHDKEFEFVDPGEPKGNVYDVYNRRETDVPYTKSCAAQKLMYDLGVKMKNNSNLKIKGELEMAECYYVPRKDKYKLNPIIEASCARCEGVLPTATGKSGKGDN
ncbi:unnamed protein product [Acanthoscelides obtectus]|uniref:Protein translocase subunit SecA n=1 Tax=Acanthoscelides obtectus TaxID=200917 RepID=A0A9P0LN35_ACAOB|nr:unnamed protein product [Acanthoscelides obtectus]CAK1629435.1 Protein translocase subunit SecA [Acanthoscelides obtectus]